MKKQKATKMQMCHKDRVTVCRKSGCRFLSECKEKWGSDCKLLQGTKITARAKADTLCGLTG